MGVIVDPAVLPGLLLLAAELAVLAAVGFVVVRVALGQDDELSALAQGLVVGPALWGLIVNFIMYAVPGMAGAAVGWAVTLILGAALAWRSPGRLRPPARMVVGFAGAVLVLGWAALASRQLLQVSDPYITLGLAASIRAGGFPVALPWHPDTPAAYHSYHYGANLLTGLLAPPTGPDLAFVWELLGVYAWVSFALVVVTALRRRGSWLTALALVPLLLGYGLHTFVWDNPSEIAGILRLPVPAGLPAAGLRASLADIYWSPLESVGSPLGSLPDVWKPAFPLGYAVAFVVLEQAARAKRPAWLGSLTLAGLVGFLGLLVTTLTPVVVVLWAGLDALRLARARRAGTPTLMLALQSGAGLAVAGLLLRFGGGALTGLLGGGAGSSGLAWAGSLDASHWQILGAFHARPGGVGLLSLGPLAVAGAAAALARRDRLALTLATGAGLLALTWLALDYPPVPQDLNRLAGHARNLALVALLLALSGRLASRRSRRWSYAACALLAGLIVWPTVAAPARSLGGALGYGVQLANAGWARPAASGQDEAAASRRYRLPGMSSRLAAYLRDHTAVDARVLDTAAIPYNPTVLLHTGRPTNWGFAGVTHLSHHSGPEYLDARHYLEPAAFRRLGLAYVYATDAWVAALPARARGWLADPDFFHRLARDGAEALYRVRPAFLALETAPHSASFEALRAAVPPATVLYLPPQRTWESQIRLVRVASVLPHARLVGAVDPERLHLRTPAPWAVAPLGARVPELIALPLLHEAWLFPPAAWRQVWRSPPGRVTVYAPNEAVVPPPAAAPPPVSVRLADVRAADARLTFTATLDDRAPYQWAGQDWALVPTDASPWAIPLLRYDGVPLIEQWFAGQAAAGGGTTTHTYIFDARASSLAVRGVNGTYTTVEASQRTPAPGAWMLALRLTRWVDRGVQEAAFIIPVLRIEVSNAGTVSYHVYDTAHGWRPP